MKPASAGTARASSDRLKRTSSCARWTSVRPRAACTGLMPGWIRLVARRSRQLSSRSPNPLGTADHRTAKQRRADALVEMAQHAMDEGKLPRRNGARPHISVNTTIEGLKGELGEAASQLGNGMPISSKTVQRLACDCTLHRVIKADSVVMDVGRATRSVSPSQWRALKARHRTCAAPECDRPINMTNPHHIEFWARGGRRDLPNLLPLCYHPHPLGHPGGRQVDPGGGGGKFIPPQRGIPKRGRRAGGRWAALTDN